MRQNLLAKNAHVMLLAVEVSPADPDPQLGRAWWHGHALVD
jgi:hypothetical protein